ncbi:hypothetical protein Adt_05481 [Abeliophyllum distichum]|uniref:Uncharacterized protein n=1 Tax=Abeliophyllum distichum TaxID=126358 RepID=A0ABD1V6B5_9LAMI
MESCIENFKLHQSSAPNFEQAQSPLAQSQQTTAGQDVLQNFDEFFAPTKVEEDANLFVTVFKRPMEEQEAVKRKVAVEEAGEEEQIWVSAQTFDQPHSPSDVSQQPAGEEAETIEVTEEEAGEEEKTGVLHKSLSSLNPQLLGVSNLQKKRLKKLK